MPLIDKPLPELLEYTGRNPKPDDFDAYWDRSIAELDAHDPAVELVPTDKFRSRGAECFDLWFTGIGGARVYAKYLRPVNRPAKSSAVLVFHGYSGKSGDWAEYLSHVAEGSCVAALDCRGQAGLSEDNLQTRGNTHAGHIVRGLDDPDPTRLLFRHIFLDTALLARIVMAFPEVDPSRVAAMGGSQGGALTLACAALEPRVRLAAPVYPFLCDYLRVWEMDLAKDAYEELRRYFRNRDATHARENDVFARLGYIDIQFLAPRIRAHTLFAVGLMDTVCPPSSQFAVYNKITAPKELVIYPDFGHEALPGHQDRIFQFFSRIRD